MNGGIAPLLLMSATIALFLAFAPLRLALFGLLAFAAAAVLGFAAPHVLALQAVFFGLWLSLIATAILVYIPAARWRMAILPMSINAGLWMGACAAMTSNAVGLALGLLPVLLAIPANWIARGKFAIILKVVASWMIAIAALSTFVSLMPTPGYKPDHME